MSGRDFVIYQITSEFIILDTFGCISPFFCHCNTHGFALYPHFIGKETETGNLYGLPNGAKLENTEMEFQTRACAPGTLHLHFASI